MLFVLHNDEWTNIIVGPIPREIPFYPAGSEKYVFLPGIGFREYVMFAIERLCGFEN